MLPYDGYRVWCSIMMVPIRRSSDATPIARGNAPLTIPILITTHGQSAHTHQAAPCCGPQAGLSPCAHPSPGLRFSLHAAAAGGLQPTSVSAPSSRAAARARMSGGTDLGHRRRPGPRQARVAPVTPILLGFGRRTPGFHSEGCAGFNSRSSELKV